MLELCYIGRLDFLAFHGTPETRAAASNRPNHLIDAAEVRDLIKARRARREAAKSSRERRR